MKNLIVGLAVAAGIGASSAQASEVTRYAVAMPHNRCMIVGTTPKLSSGAIVIPFGMKFKKTPVVSAQPVWIGSVHSVGSIETITEVSTDHFTVLSGNGTPNVYFVSW